MKILPSMFNMTGPETLQQENPLAAQEKAVAVPKPGDGGDADNSKPAEVGNEGE